MTRAIVLNAADNVATLLRSGLEGESCTLEGERSGEVKLRQDVAFGHKVCIADTAAGASVVKYGEVIGRASRQIRVGEHAHVHNIQSRRQSDLSGA